MKINDNTHIYTIQIRGSYLTKDSTFYSGNYKVYQLFYLKSGIIIRVVYFKKLVNFVNQPEINKSGTQMLFQSSPL